MIDIALKYLSLGWSCIPITRSGRRKKPTVYWKEYQDRHPTEEEARSWWDRGSPPGIAVICGRISGLIVLDVESNGVDLFPRYETLTAKSHSGGLHYYFRYVDRPLCHSLSANGEHVADLRSDGAYVVAPPSWGEKGQYEWVHGAKIAGLPDEKRFTENPPTCTPSRLDAGRRSRSERLLAIANRVVREGGSADDVMTACLADPAGSKLLEKTPEQALRYVQQMVDKTTAYDEGESVVATLVGVSDNETNNGERRVEVKLQLADGRMVREGITRRNDVRWQAFQSAVPDLRCGVNVRVVLHEVDFSGRKIIRVRRWL